VLKPAVFLLCLGPAAVLLLRALQVGGLTLGANPVAALIHGLGLWGLRLLLLTLAITPLHSLTGWPHWLRFRRMLGLFAFFYLVLHFLAYVVIDQSLDMAILIEDVMKRRWITIGVLGLLLLVPLAVTSTQRMMRRLGRRWTALHRLIYPAALLGCWHFYWQVKADVREPLAYSGVLALLLLWRWWLERAARRRQLARTAATRRGGSAGVSVPQRG
jgi:sulfoxide reductase heme-binding subunit YedZ